MSGPRALQLDDLAPSSLPFVRDFGAAGEAGEKDVNRALEPEGLIAASDRRVDVRTLKPNLDRLPDKVDHIVHVPSPPDSGPSIRIGRLTCVGVKRHFSLISKVERSANKHGLNNIRSGPLFAAKGRQCVPGRPAFSFHIGTDCAGAA